jgi:hypothetical protein
MENYVNTAFGDFTKEQDAVFNAVIYEGEMRQNEKVIALLERKLVESYQDKEMVNFYYNLIAEIQTL